MLFAIITLLFHCNVHHLSQPQSLSGVFTNLVSVAGWLHAPAMLRKHQLFLFFWINLFCQYIGSNVGSVNYFCFKHLTSVFIRLRRNSETDYRWNSGQDFLTGRKLLPGPGLWGILLFHMKKEEMREDVRYQCPSIIYTLKTCCTTYGICSL